MQLKKLLWLFVLIMPLFVFAEEDGKVVARDVKYLKTVSVLNNSEVATIANPELASFTTEISEEEYNAVNVDDLVAEPNTVIQTNYKRLESQIIQMSSYYRYRVDLTWKTMPATRSVDVIGIGYYASVKASNSYIFMQKYCLTSGTCYQGSGYTKVSGKNGIAAVFYLPTEELSSLSQYFYVDMLKTNSNTTIIEQVAVGDYAHATKSVPFSDAKNFAIDTGGIYHYSPSNSYYDTTPEATAGWTGEW